MYTEIIHTTHHELSICRYGSNANLPSVISASMVVNNGWDGP